MPNDSGPDRGPSYPALLTVCCLVTFGCYLSVSMRLPIVPLHARGFGVTTAQIGVINAAFYLMAGLLSLPSGALSDIFGRKHLARVGALVIGAGMLLLDVGRSYGAFAGIYLLLGAGIAAFGPTMMAWVSEIAPRTHLGRAYGWYTTALFSGMGLGPAIGGAVGGHFGYSPVFWGGAGLVAVVLWAVGRFLPAPQRRHRPRRAQVEWPGVPGAVFSNRPLIGCWAATFGACVIAGMFFSFFPLYADNRGLAVEQIGVVFLVQSIANAVSRIPFGIVSDRLGRRHYQALTGAVLITLSIAAFAVSHSFWHFVLAGIGLGISNGIAFTAIGALIAETVEPRSRGVAMGGYNGCIYFGLMAGSIGLGPLIEATGFARGFFLTALIHIPFILYFAWSMAGYRRMAAGPDASEDGVGPGTP